MSISTTPYFLSNDRVSLRGFRQEDLEHYQRWIDNPAVTHFMEMGWKASNSFDLQKTYI